MAEFSNSLRLHSPPERSKRVGDAQWLLAHNRHGQNFHPGEVDDEYGKQTAGAAHRAKFWMGYPNGAIDDEFGQQIYSYLLELSHPEAARLPATFRLRRDLRLKAVQPVGKAKALKLALHDVGVTESPAYSNCQRYGSRYGMNCVAWCCIAATCWMVDAGVPGFRLGSFWSYVPAVVDAARGGHSHLALTSAPEPGDLVTYTTREGPNEHIELFEAWIDRTRGTFWAVGGNTSYGSTVESNGGEVCRNERYLSMVTHFVRVGI